MTVDKPLLGIGLILLANFTFSFIDASTKWLAIAGLPALQIAFMRYFGHFVISTGLITRYGVNWQTFACEKPLLVLLRGICLMLSTVLNFFAVRYLPLTLTSTILFSAPIIVCALSWPLLRERVGKFRIGAILFGFCGILVAIRPFDESFHWATLLSLGGAVAFAFYSILTRKLADVVSVDAQQFYAGLVGSVVLLPFAFFSWQAPATLLDWTILCALGFFGWAGHQLLTNAMRHAPANLLMPFGYTFILYLTVWSYFLFNTTPDRYTIAGAAIIVVAGLIIWLRERQLMLERRAV